MTIEVKQLIIKSMIDTDVPTMQSSQTSPQELEQFKEQLLQECRELINETLSKANER